LSKASEAQNYYMKIRDINNTEAFGNHLGSEATLTAS